MLTWCLGKASAKNIHVDAFLVNPKRTARATVNANPCSRMAQSKFRPKFHRNLMLSTKYWLNINAWHTHTHPRFVKHKHETFHLLHSYGMVCGCSSHDPQKHIRTFAAIEQQDVESSWTVFSFAMHRTVQTSVHTTDFPSDVTRETYFRIFFGHTFPGLFCFGQNGFLCPVDQRPTSQSLAPLSSPVNRCWAPDKNLIWKRHTANIKVGI